MYTLGLVEDLFPVRCYNCGKSLAQNQIRYESMRREGLTPSDAMDALGYKRYCCRMNILNPSKILIPPTERPSASISISMRDLVPNDSKPESQIQSRRTRFANDLESMSSDLKNMRLTRSYSSSTGKLLTSTTNVPSDKMTGTDDSNDSELQEIMIGGVRRTGRFLKASDPKYSIESTQGWDMPAAPQSQIASRRRAIPGLSSRTRRNLTVDTSLQISQPKIPVRSLSSQQETVEDRSLPGRIEPNQILPSRRISRGSRTQYNRISGISTSEIPESQGMLELEVSETSDLLESGISEEVDIDVEEEYDEFG